MAAPRLPFLWPMLYRASEHVAPSARSVVPRRALHNTVRRRQNHLQQRYGSANEPLPHLGGGKGYPPPTNISGDQKQKALPKIGETLQKDGEQEVREDQAEEEAAKEMKTEPTTTDAPSTIPEETKSSAAESMPKAEPPASLKMPVDKPMETLLDAIPTPSAKEDQDSKASEEDHPAVSYDEHQPPIHAPHMDTPRYVHHFDTYGLVKRLQDGGWSEEQAITVMKAMRLILAENMTLADEALVSRSNVENETYLFRAACSELRTEIMTRRRVEQEKQRTQRTQLQHEVDILIQRLSQETGVLKDDLKGMFDDRKMAVRNEQRSMESKIQELNYKITVSLQADSRSDVEGLRWVMTRRVIITLAIIVVMVLSSLKLYSSAAHERELEAKRRANRKSGGTQTDDFDSQHAEIGGRREDRALGGGEILVKDGDNPAFVSLG